MKYKIKLETNYKKMTYENYLHELSKFFFNHLLSTILHHQYAGINICLKQQLYVNYNIISYIPALHYNIILHVPFFDDDFLLLCL